LGLAICFESILPGHALDAVQAGAEVLVVAANDAWLPRYAVDQHILLSALRGREVGREVLFVSNGGPALRLVSGQARARSESAPLPVSAVRRTGQTPWVRWGDWGLVAGAAALVGIGLMWRADRKRKKRI
jgi:apolipoprotein N-acyltransferase